jgi:hypothetical protein
MQDTMTYTFIGQDLVVVRKIVAALTPHMRFLPYGNIGHRARPAKVHRDESHLVVDDSLNMDLQRLG